MNLKGYIKTIRGRKGDNLITSEFEKAIKERIRGRRRRRKEKKWEIEEGEFARIENVSNFLFSFRFSNLV